MMKDTTAIAGHMIDDFALDAGSDPSSRWAVLVPDRIAERFTAVTRLVR
jgi:hypothetical protein